MIDVTSIINDPDFNQQYNLIRVTPTMTNGRAGTTESAVIPLDGIVLPAKLDELALLPEGERLKASIAVYSLTELRMDNQIDQMADLIEYPRDSGEWYRVAWTRYYAQCVLWYGIAVRFQRAA